MNKAILSSLLLLALPITTIIGQERRSLTDQLSYSISMQGSATDGDYTPLWLNANRYGLSSLDKTNGYLRASIERPLALDVERKWGVGYGIDVAAAYNHTSTFIIQQAYGELRWLNGVLTVGSKQYPMELKSQKLSSGSQTLGINARPIPQVRLALPDYWALPFTNGWVSIKGHFAYGMTTDNNWQTDFSKQKTKYTQNTLYHSKAGFLKIGNEYRFMPVSLELGVEMATQFGGTSWVYNRQNGLDKIENASDLRAFWNALIPGGGEAVEDTYRNTAGNQLGTWMMRLNFDYDAWYLGFYAEHFFEDHSSMFHLDYDGYGSGSQWDTREDSRYITYDLKDMMLGAELRLKNATWLNDIVFEYIYSKYQSGPIYHDHTQNISDHIGGNDNYYNHYVYTGWQHWGQVIGNPLYLSPLYNTDGRIEVENNRMYAFHLGLSGNPSYNLDYRVLATWQKGFGLYDEPYDRPRESVNALAEATYSFAEQTPYEGWSVTLGAGLDIGKLRGDNYGVQLTIAKTGIFDLKNKQK